MPAYEYACQACGSHFERRQKMSEPEVRECPSCNGPVKRLISGGAGIVSKEGSSPASGPMCGNGGPCCMQEMGGAPGCGCAH